MELDNLKDIWKEAGEKNKQPVSTDEILNVLNKPSQSPIAKMKRNVFIELSLMVILFGAVAVYYFIAFGGKFSEVAWMYIIVSCFSVLYYYRKAKLLNAMQCNACQVKSNLQLQTRTLEKYVRFYLMAGTALIPLILVFFGVLFYFKFPESRDRFFLYPSWHNPSVWAVVEWFALLAVGTALIYFVNRWYVKRLYGQHIEKLKNLLSQLEEETA